MISCSIILFLLIWALILRFTKKITYPINQLTSLTEEIKRATGRDNLEVVLNKIESHDIFQETKKQISKSKDTAKRRRQGAPSSSGDTGRDRSNTTTSQGSGDNSYRQMKKNLLDRDTQNKGSKKPAA